MGRTFIFGVARAVSLTACSAQSTTSGPQTAAHLTFRDGARLTVAFPSDIDLSSDGVEMGLPFEDDFDARLDGSSGSLLVFTDACNRMSRYGDEAHVYGLEVFSLCDEPSDTLFSVRGSAAASGFAKPL